ncbi:hypothetical protein CWR43_15590 [Rhizobium sullae]|uniref:Uncharacterized protein n=1 Tax=Rhizobium sullae TaxID=50338 RepID=A0A2N0D9P3_RHISU|nr:hypothetical protein CWR43_15590 [Rhizobium sullae]
MRASSFKRFALVHGRRLEPLHQSAMACLGKDCDALEIFKGSEETRFAYSFRLFEFSHNTYA